MPATFGSGTGMPAGSADGPNWFPIKLWEVNIPAGGSITRTWNTGRSLAVVTAIDVVSTGGGSGGLATFFAHPLPVPWWAINIGSSVDTFEWRGFYIIEGNHGWSVDNASDIPIGVTACGYIAPDPQVVFSWA